MLSVSEEEFEAFLKKHPLAIPDGFRIVGGMTQTSYIENGVEVARFSRDGFGPTWEVDLDSLHLR